ncbi:hypothetical protein FIBSPDRAFT_851270 [Athelia psychrophila]|uniref:Uncharacterized protein n=1 Tax=Athelia psychrophila TaxID=1759441 RepID=A0A166SNY9_9AGAM|nr:hypothetical protein FIBSPDRAFT_851270 [Fibularhizoctonia sp. CBS 109695]
MSSFADIDHKAIFLGILCGGSALGLPACSGLPTRGCSHRHQILLGKHLDDIAFRGGLGQAITRVGDRCQSGSEPETERQVVIPEGRATSTTDWTDRPTRWRNAS